MGEQRGETLKTKVPMTRAPQAGRGQAALLPLRPHPCLSSAEGTSQEMLSFSPLRSPQSCGSRGAHAPPGAGLAPPPQLQYGSSSVRGDRTAARAERTQHAAACDEPGPGEHSASRRHRPPGTLAPGRSPWLESKDQAGRRVWLPGPSTRPTPACPQGLCAARPPGQGHRFLGPLPCPKRALHPEGPAGPFCTPHVPAESQ